MRVLMTVTFPTWKFNRMIGDGTAGPAIEKALKASQSEAAYFFASDDGQRSAVLIVDMPTAADLPRFAEPWFAAFEAQVRASPAMTPEEVASLDLKALGGE